MSESSDVRIPVPAHLEALINPQRSELGVHLQYLRVQWAGADIDPFLTELQRRWPIFITDTMRLRDVLTPTQVGDFLIALAYGTYTVDFVNFITNSVTDSPRQGLTLDLATISALERTLDDLADCVDTGQLHEIARQPSHRAQAPLPPGINDR